jgi:hypothetical protein
MRQKVREALKELRQLPRPSQNDSDTEGEVEVVEYHSAHSTKRRHQQSICRTPKRRFSLSPSSKSRIKQESDEEHGQLYEGGGSINSPIDMSNSPARSSLFLIVSPMATRLRIVSSIPASPQTTQLASCASTTPTAPWPHGLYAIDVSKGFKQIDALERGSLSLKARFEQVFDVPFVKSTYHDARRRWTLARQSQRDAAINAGHSPPGLWSIFARGVPLK